MDKFEEEIRELAGKDNAFDKILLGFVIGISDDKLDTFTLAKRLKEVKNKYDTDKEAIDELREETSDDIWREALIHTASSVLRAPEELLERVMSDETTQKGEYW